MTEPTKEEMDAIEQMKEELGLDDKFELFCHKFSNAITMTDVKEHPNPLLVRLLAILKRRARGSGGRRGPGNESNIGGSDNAERGA